ncbi:MAG TPA: AMP-binding protein [Solirubrobacterales bacterium]|nr:AMP-binding protein [Solirubrobacterales bacterium]
MTQVRDSDFDAPRVLGDVSRMRTADSAGRTAITFGSERISYLAWERMANALAAELIDRGVRPGERVALLLPNGPGFLVAYSAIAKAGAVAVPVGTRLGASEMRFLLDHGGTRLLVHDAVTAQVAAGLGDVATIDLDEPGLATMLGAAPTAAEDEAAELAGRLPAVAPESDAAIFYTSGTTASPKGARLSHRAILNCARIVGERFGITAEDVALANLPLYHTATHFIPLPTLVAGGTVVVHEGFKVEEAFELLERHRITLFPTVTAVAILMEKFATAKAGEREFDLDALRKVFVGGAGVPPSLLDSWSAFAPRTTMVNCYGLTEMAPAVSSHDPGLMDAPSGSVGLPYPGVEVRIVREDGGPADADEVGEVLIRSASVMSGYLDNPEATAAALRDGWLHTGDLGTRDADGFLAIVGRKKHMLKRGGENVFPDEVEAALIRHPSVREAIVVGVPDEVMGERVGAIVASQAEAVVEPGELVSACAGLLADFKVPEYVSVVDGELPKNAVGKVDARRLHEAAREGTIDWIDLRRGRARGQVAPPRATEA